MSWRRVVLAWLWLACVSCFGCAKRAPMPEIHRDCVAVNVPAVGSEGVKSQPAWLCARDSTRRVQTHTRAELSITNLGQLATEQTHRVRAHSMPGSITAGVSVRRSWLVGGASFTHTTLTVSRCASVPCTSTGRDFRPGRTEPIEQQADAVVAVPRIGLAWRLIEAGISAPMLQSAYTLVGASPMLVWAPYGAIAVQRGAVSLFGRYTIVPPQPARFVALSEWAGYKRVGEDFPNGKNDPLWLRFLEVGMRIGQ